jgi:chlorite dismutase
MIMNSKTEVAPRPATHAQPAIQRQFVNFAFFKLDPAFRRLGANEKQQAREEFVGVIPRNRPGLLCLTESTAGLRPDADRLLWRISLSPGEFQSQTQAINKTAFGGILQLRGRSSR